MNISFMLAVTENWSEGFQYLDHQWPYLLHKGPVSNLTDSKLSDSASSADRAVAQSKIPLSKSLEESDCV